MVHDLKAYKKSVYIGLSILLMMAQMTPFFVFNTPQASAFVPGATCINDVVGANDEPNQKDLTQMCILQSFDVTNGVTYGVYWAWDDTAWPGGNTGDACSLLDDDANGFADVSVCVTVGGNPAAQTAGSPRFYSCTDTSSSRCFGATAITMPVSPISTCSVVSNDPIDPYPTGDMGPLDTSARCVLVASELGLSQSALLRDVCSYPSQIPNSDPSDCIRFTSKALIEVKKNLSPTNDTGLFNLSVAGTSTIAGVGHNGTTGEVAVDSGSVTVLESAAAGTSLSNYTTSITCNDQNAGGQVVASGTRTGATTRQITFTAPPSSDILCTFTNTRIMGGLTVIKELNQEYGGNEDYSDFSFVVNGYNNNQPIAFETDGINELQVPLGTYSVTEVAHSAYTTTYGNCEALTIVQGQTQTCTITNTAKPATITINKIVVNDNGGTQIASSFTPLVNGDNLGESFTDTSPSSGTVTYEVAEGEYTVTESPANGYVASYSNCGPIDLYIGENTTCTITNNDIAPTLTVIKTLIQNNGGTKALQDFSFSINNGPAINVESDGTTVVSLNAGTYSVVETFAQGYDVDYENCSGIQLSIGQSATCEITNDDQPAYATITKSFVNTFNGDLTLEDFIFKWTASGGQVSIVESGIAIMLNAGSYTASETADQGVVFEAGVWGGDCAANGLLSVELGGSYDCTITNYDVPAIVHIHKTVVNDNGGTKNPDDFSYQMSGFSGTYTFPESGSVSFPIPAGSFSVTEIADTDYATSYDGCSFSAVSGSEYSCYITNNDIPPVLTVDKYTEGECTVLFEAAIQDCEGERFQFTLQNNNQQYANFSLGNGSTYSTVSGLKAGVASLSENESTGWYLDNVVCYNSTDEEYFSPESFSVELGKHYHCTFENVAYANVIVTKFHDENKNGQWDDDEPTLSNWEMVLTKESTCSGRMTAVEILVQDENQEEDDCLSESSETKVTNELGEALFDQVEPGYYSVDEVIQAGWEQSAAYCDYQYLEITRLESESAEQTNQGYVGAGSTTYCYVGNYRTPPVIIVTNNTTPPAVLGTSTSKKAPTLASTGVNLQATIVVGILTIGIVLFSGRATKQ